MDVSSWLLRHTPPRPLVVTTPGGTEARLATEHVVREHGWHTAANPAEANILVIAGPTGHTVRPYLDQVWGLIPAPRARAAIGTPAAAPTELAAAATALRDIEHQRRQAVHPGHANHANHEMPGDVPMADRAEDRDGLMLDQLHVPLGPVLPDWPAGLVVRTTLQGDVIQEATAEVVGVDDVRDGSFWDRPWRDSTPGSGMPAASATRWLTARRLDSCARLLSVAGWPDASAVARRLRDDALHGAQQAETARSLAVWAKRVRRSRILRWSLAGVGVTADDPSTPPALRGDALTRLRLWIDSALRVLDGPGSEEAPESGFDGAHETQWTLDALPALLEGSELATARLLVASLDPDPDALADHEVRHG